MEMSNLGLVYLLKTFQHLKDTRLNVVFLEAGGGRITGTGDKPRRNAGRG
jgi:hypothetical protein